MNITIIGGGNMGLTYAKSFINARVVKPENLTILERSDSTKLEELKKLGIASIETEPVSIQDSDLIILAVKPQDIISLFTTIKPMITDDQIVISIMAGVTIQTIQNGLGVKKVVRAMPNLPAQIRHGMTGFTCTDEVTRLELGVVQNLLSQTGKTLQVKDEDSIDVITAISGSGPAYIYYFMESMMETARNMGMNEAEAELLVLETFLGALTLFQQQPYSCNDWIDRVSSKGGTTEAAINRFNELKLNTSIENGVKAALERARELGSKS